MKKLSLITVIILTFLLSVSAQRTYVLLAGVSNYGDEEINLPNSTKDVKRLKKVFDKQELTTVALITSENANHDNIIKKLKAIATLSKPDDKIFFFFSGHGTPGGFVPSDRSFFNYQELVDILSKTKSQNVVCFIDACMSGSVKNISANNFGLGDSFPKITFVTATAGTEAAVESLLVGNGFFSKALLKGLRGMSDKDKDKNITLIELFNFVYKDVTARTKNENAMHPQLIGPKSMHNIVITKW